ncbi:Vegetative incompatibility protein HET-E-1-like protein 20 [Phlyctema vagabunda]|uniref:Vegetative incompatibility protein HET-E-1-like protein 20 n=1 Tax=Phlyctema vagabunda TaxID=108571 RepID=A0ABR4PHS1_9HELO
MASFKTDAELMTNYVAASPVPAGSHFRTLLDENNKPIVVSLSNDETPKLQVVRHDAQGLQYLFDLKSYFELPKDAIIQAFDVTQDNGKTIYLAFAYTRDGQRSSAIIAKPFAPIVLQNGAKLPKLNGTWTFGLVKRVFMSPIPVTAQSSALYPLIFVTHKNLDQLVSWGDDLTRLVPDENLVSWTKDSSLSTLVNVSSVLDVCTATNIHGQGIFVLYETSSGASKIYGQFMKPDPQSDVGSMMNWASELQCPQDTRCIETFQEDTNDSGLVLGSSNGLYYHSARGTIDKLAKPILISDSPKMRGCKSLVVAQDKKDISIWFTTNDDQLGYLRSSTVDFKSPQLREPVLLLPKGSSTSFSPLLTSPTADAGNVYWQMLVSNDRDGNLTLLEQGSDLGLWRRKPFYSNDTAENMPIKSFSITVKAIDGKNAPIKNASVKISSSSAVTGLLNGTSATLSPSSVWFDTDDQGTLNFVIPTESIASQVLSLEGIKGSDGKELLTKIKTIDPTQRCMEKLGAKLDELDNVDKLRTATTQSGNPLFSMEAMPSNEDLRDGLKSLKQLHSVYSSLPSDGSRIVEPNAKSKPASNFVSDSIATSACVRTSFIAPQSSAILPATGSIVGSIEDWLMDKWHWITENAEKVGKWFVDTSGRVWKFVCEIAGEAFEFVLDCVEKIGEALTWVWDKIKVGIEKLIEFIGFIFDWDDILKTKDTVSALITAGCDLAARKVGAAASAVDGYFDGILAKIDGIEAVKDISASSSSGTGNDTSSTKVNDAQHSTSFNWTGERMKNGGMSTSSDVTRSSPTQKDAQKTWDEIFTPALASIRKAFEKVGDDIKALWSKNGAITANDFLGLSRDVLKSGVITIQKLVVALIEAFQKVIQLVSEYGNKEIHIPIFSKLYEMISGHKLTAFDAMSLLIAIPATIFTKLIIGKAPPQILGLNADVLDGLVFGNKSIPITPQMQLDFNVLTTGLTVSATLIGAIVNFIKFTVALANEGTGGAMEVLSSSSFVEFFSVILDMFGALNAIPSDPDIPGYEYRKWISYFTMIRGGSHVIATFVPSKVVPTEAKDKLLLVLDLATTLINFALYQVVANSEIESKTSWKDYDEGSTIVGVEGSVLNAVSGVGYFVAFMFKEDVEISGVRLIVLEACTVALAAVEGIKWKIDYDRNARCLLTPSST